MPRPRQYANHAERERAYRLRKRLAQVAPDAVCSEMGLCTMYCDPC